MQFGRELWTSWTGCAVQVEDLDAGSADYGPNLQGWYATFPADRMGIP